MQMKLLRRHRKSMTVSGEVLSSDPETRRVELALLARVVEVARKTADAALLRANGEPGPELAAYARFTSPIYASMARRMEANVPEDTGFGKFRGKK